MNEFEERDLVARAIAYSISSHGSMLDRSGKLFILHPLRVMLAVAKASLPAQAFSSARPAAMAMAILHDVVEDTAATLHDVRWFFGEAIADGVDALTRRDHETYGDYVERCRAHPLAREVKYRDVLDNLERMQGLPEDEVAGMTKRYERAIRVLEDVELAWADAR